MGGAAAEVNKILKEIDAEYHDADNFRSNKEIEIV